MNHEGIKTEKLEKLTIRIGILYILPALIVVACLFYESSYYEDWMRTWWMDICQNTKYLVPCPISVYEEQTDPPRKDICGSDGPGHPADHLGVQVGGLLRQIRFRLRVV